MDILLLGPPGAGKGTQGAILAERLRIPKFATGDLLRDAVARGSALGLEAKSYMNQGLLVPDEVILGLIGEVLALPEAAAGVVMDGFPRTVGQAEAVDARLAARGQQVQRVLLFDVPEEELVRRVVSRASAEGRTDDTPETIQRRLGVYRLSTAPLVGYYRERGVLTTINGTGTVEEIAERVQEVVGA